MKTKTHRGAAKRFKKTGNGKFKRALTRGDGSYGDDVSNNAITIRTLPIKLDENNFANIEVRGEAFISKSDFNKFEFISALVKINDNIVARLGAIMPEPLAIPEIFINSSPIIISSYANFGLVSVVIIAEERPCFTSFCILTASLSSEYFITYSMGAKVSV